MNLSLNPEVRQFIEERVRAGQYATAEEVVHEAIARLRRDKGLAAEERDTRPHGQVPPVKLPEPIRPLRPITAGEVAAAIREGRE